MPFIGVIKNTMSARERAVFFGALIVLALSLIIRGVMLVRENSIFVPVRGGSYIEGVAGQPTLINPAVSQNPVDLDISALVYSPLSDLIANTEVQPDGKTYAVKLKEHLVWDDGTPLTSDDVIFTVQTIQGPDSNSPAAKNWQGVTIERVSELHINFTLPDPFSFFPDVLKRTRVVPKHIFGNIPVENYRLSDYSLEPVGNGPYKVVSFKKQKDGFITEYHLVPNSRYAGQTPYISDFYFRFYQTENDLTDAFLARKVHGIGSITPFTVNSSAASSSNPLGDLLTETSRIKIDVLPMPRYYAIFINQASDPALKSLSVRRALDLAIDKTKLVSLFGEGNAAPISNPLVVNPLDFSTSTSGVEDSGAYDPDTARNLLAAAGAQNMKLTITVPDVPILASAVDFVKRAWVSAGVGEVTINTVDTSAVIEDAIQSRDFELLLFGNILENPLDLFPFWHSSQRMSPKLNITSYQNTEVDRLIENVRKATDKNEQLRMTSQAAARIQNDEPAIFLFALPYFYAHTDKLSGIGTDAVAMPSNRFQNIVDWSVLKARALR
ncbi:MAG: ABC transporter substrate-binding protein [Candidatus Jorgensenbacteria bacterium]|nr:ABC transporter substrate-binding protein [Candidatus Jorgensenbacteria bacterium]